MREAAAGAKPFTHEERAQRRKGAKHFQAHAAHDLRRKHAGQKRTIECIDGAGAGQNIRASRAVISANDPIRTGICRIAFYGLDQRFDIARSQIEALCADWRKKNARLRR